MEAKAIFDLTKSAMAKWHRQRRAGDRNRQARVRRSTAMMSIHIDTKKDVAERVFPEIYDQVSSGGTLPALARQIGYRVRPRIQEETGESVTMEYIIQKLLPDFIRENPSITKNWDVVYDAHGAFFEPHTRRRVPLGTIDVRRYIERILHHEDDEPVQVDKGRLYPTIGAENRFGAILFCEKEGFNLLLEKTGIDRKYDLALMSTKGFSNVASRRLTEFFCKKGWDKKGIPIFILHDFDKAGIAILHTLHTSNERYTFGHTIRFVDAGLRLLDVKRYGLEGEQVYYGNSDPTWNLSQNGATKEEIEFLYHGDGMGKRVELNALSTGDFIDMIERKLKEHGIKKVIPDEKILTKAYRRFVEAEAIAKAIEEARRHARELARDTEVPKDLQRRVRIALKRNPDLPWDDPVIRLARKAMRS